MNIPGNHRLIFADELSMGDVILTVCTQTEHAKCHVDATVHEPGHLHEHTVLRARSGDGTVHAISLDESGEQRPLYNMSINLIAIRS